MFINFRFLVTSCVAGALILTGSCESKFNGDEFKHRVIKLSSNTGSVEALNELLVSQNPKRSGSDSYEFYSTLFEAMLREPMSFYIITKRNLESRELVYTTLERGVFYYTDWNGSKIPEELEVLKETMLERLKSESRNDPNVVEFCEKLQWK